MATDSPAKLSNFLEKIRIRNAGPFEDFTIEFQDPVTVISGPNGSGKSTILLAASSAYIPCHFPSAGMFDPLLPHRFNVPRGHEKSGAPSLHFTYRLDDKPSAFSLELLCSMTASTPNDPNGCRPDLPTYIRTHGHLSNIPQVPEPDPKQPALAASIINKVLGREYVSVETASDGRGHPEPACQRPDGSLDRLDHMSYGEAVLTRLAYDLTRFHGGLALVDYVEMGLEPAAQKALMEELTALSPRNRIQFIITTHSPEIMGAAPPAGRTFLQKDEEGRITALQPR